MFPLKSSYIKWLTKWMGSWMKYEYEWIQIIVIMIKI